MTITDNSGTVVTEASVIAKYFRKPEENLQNFMQQIRELTPESKTELAVGAAKELGYTVS